MVARATSLRTLKSVMTSSDSLTPKTHNLNGISISSAVFAQRMHCVIILYNGTHLSPLKIAPSHGGSGPHGSLGLPESSTQTASQLVQPFLHRLCTACLYFTMECPFPPSKLPLLMGDLDPMVPWVYPSPQPKRHLDQCSHFCRAH